jgi:hypothetical protein
MLEAVEALVPVGIELVPVLLGEFEPDKLPEPKPELGLEEGNWVFAPKRAAEVKVWQLEEAGTLGWYGMVLMTPKDSAGWV